MTTAMVLPGERLERPRMEDLGSEIGKLGRLVPGKRRTGSAIGDEVRVGAHEAVDVLPDLQGGGVEGGGHHGGAVVGAVSSEGRDPAFRRPAEKAGDHRHGPGPEELRGGRGVGLPEFRQVHGRVFAGLLCDHSDLVGVLGRRGDANTVQTAPREPPRKGVRRSSRCWP